MSLDAPIKAHPALTCSSHPSMGGEGLLRTIPILPLPGDALFLLLPY